MYSHPIAHAAATDALKALVIEAAISGSYWATWRKRRELTHYREELGGGKSRECVRDQYGEVLLATEPASTSTGRIWNIRAAQAFIDGYMRVWSNYHRIRYVLQ